MSFLQATKNNRSGAGGGFLGALDRDVSDSPKGFYSAVNQPKKSSSDLESIDGLLKLAKQRGIIGGDEVNEKDKLSFLQRLSFGLGALNPAEAIMDDIEGTENFLVSYGKGAVQGIASALTGNDYGEQTKKRYFGDVVEAMGVENKVAKFGLGLVGDILLDPSTYFGGTLIRGAAKGVGFVAKAGHKVAEKAAPALVGHLDDAGKALRAAGGELFVFGYGASKKTTTGTAKGLAGEYLEFEGKKMNVQRSLAISNTKRFGTDVLTDNQWDEFLGHLFKGKTAEFNYFDDVTDEMLDAFNVKFPGAFPLKTSGFTRKTTLPQNLQSIATKASKYKNADEFINKETTSFDDLPDPLKGALMSETRAKITNDGVPSSVAISDMKSKRYIEIDYKISEIRKDNPDIFTDTFTKRGSMTKGSIIIDDFGRVIDGNNRVREAFERGESSISAFLESPKSSLIEFYDQVIKGGEGVATMKKALTEKFGREASDIEVRSAIREQTISKLASVSAQIPVKIGKLQVLRDKLATPFIADDLIGLKATMSELRKELADLLPSAVTKVPKGKPFMATAEQIDGALMNALGSQKEKYTKIILDLEAKIAGIESGLITPAMKQVIKQVGEGGQLTSDEILQQVMRRFDPTLKIKDKLTDINLQITKLTNDMAMKEHILNGVLAGKQIAKERIGKAVASGNWRNLPEELMLALKPVIKDEVVAKAVTERLTRNAKLAAQAGIDEPFTMYAPSIAKDVTEKERILQFFSGTKGVKIGSKDYIKEFKNLLKDSELIKDRALFLRVEDEIATNKVTQEFLEGTVKDYGKGLKEFATEKMANDAGFKMLKDKGIFGKELGYVLNDDWKFLNSHINGNFKALDAIAKNTGFDAATSLFKRFVTGIFAPFHVRNFASGEIQNFEILGTIAQSPKVQAAGLRLGTKISRGAYTALEDPFDLAFKVGKQVDGFGDEVVELAGKSWKLDDIGRAIEDRFGGSSRYNVDFNTITDDASALIDSSVFSKEALKGWGKSFVSFRGSKNPIEGLIGQDALHFKAARAVGAWVEMQQKSKLVVGALAKGMNMEDALGIAAKGGFDYRALTQFESKVLRRIIPFYSFNRFNVELQLKVLGENPQRINQVIRSIENVQNLWETNLTEKEKENLPAYLKEYLSVPVGRTNQGVPQFIRSFGTPIEAFTELVKFKAEGKSTLERSFLGMLSKVNPYIKVPIELGTGIDSFRQRDIKEVYTAPEYEHAPQFIKDYLQIKKVVKKDFATGLPRTTFVADPERLLIVRSLFTSRGFTYFNNVFNGNVEGFLKIMDLTSGIRVTEIDVERQAGFNERRKIEELGDLLRRNGVLSEFNKLFIPKEK